MATRKKTKKSGKRKVQKKKTGRRPGNAAQQKGRRRTAKTRRASSASKLDAVPQIFEALASVLAPYAHLFECGMHPRFGYCLKTYGEWPSEIFFGGVALSPGCARFHCLIAERHPWLLDGISPALRKRCDGRTSFRFEGIEPELFAELAVLLRAGFDCLVREGLYGRAA